MGYDLHVVNEAGDWPTEAGESPDRYDGPFYFRRNMSGMGWTLEPMLALDMAYHAAGLHGRGYPDWDQLPDKPGEWGDGVHWDGDDAPISDEARAHRKLVDDFLKATWDERPGIPAHKFSSNDGWWVTAAECKSALEIWERAGSPMPEPFMDDLIPFLRTAAQHSGFRVY